MAGDSRNAPSEPASGVATLKFEAGANDPRGRSDPDITVSGRDIGKRNVAGGSSVRSSDSPTVKSAVEAAESRRAQHVEYIGRFRIKREIARGRFGIVYEGVDERLGRPVAIKRAKPEVRDDVEQVRRFAQEAELASSLEHPGIVPIHEVGTEDGELFIVMGLCADRTLTYWMRHYRPVLTPGRVVRMFLQVVEAVAYGHRRGVIHRDLKPDNIGISDAAGETSPNGLPTLRVLDFGLSYSLEQTIRHTRSSVTMGTPLYMAPEQLRSSEVGPEADVYSLGSMLYELLTGRTPFEGETSAEVVDQLWRDRPQAPSEHNPEVPEELDAICMMCLEKRPADRYRTANELVTDLNRWLEGRPTSARPDSLPRRAKRWAAELARVRESGAVIVIIHLFLLVWAIGGHVGAQMGDDRMSAASMMQMTVYLASVTFPVHLTFVWAGYRMWQGKPPRLLMGGLLAAAAVLFVWHLGRGLQVFPPPMQWYADHPSAAWMVFWMLSLTAAIDVGALSLGLFACRKSADAIAERSGQSDVITLEATSDA